MEDKFTDNEIVKALECCIEVDACHRCPYGAACLDDKYKSIIAKDALDLINRKNVEIGNLKADLIIAKRHEKDARELFKDATAEIDRLRGALSPCNLCRYNPPSSMGGKPCSVCPASAKEA